MSYEICFGHELFSRLNIWAEKRCQAEFGLFVVELAMVLQPLSFAYFEYFTEYVSNDFILI